MPGPLKDARRERFLVAPPDYPDLDEQFYPGITKLRALLDSCIGVQHELRYQLPPQRTSTQILMDLERGRPSQRR